MYFHTPIQMWFKRNDGLKVHSPEHLEELLALPGNNEAKPPADC